MESVMSEACSGNLTGFSTDYYVAIKSGKESRISKGYVASRQNAFYADISEVEELERVKRLISGQTRELMRTDVGHHLRRSLQMEYSSVVLNAFYPKEDVEFVRNLMLGREV